MRVLKDGGLHGPRPLQPVETPAQGGGVPGMTARMFASEAPSGRAGLSWLADHAWPLWLEHGVDWQRRAFHEHLDSASLQCRASFRRLRVAARQTYVFSKAARQRWRLGLTSCRGRRGFLMEASPGVSILTAGRST